MAVHWFVSYDKLKVSEDGWFENRQPFGEDRGAAEQFEKRMQERGYRTSLFWLNVTTTSRG